MPRNMSFAMTKDQVRARTKTVTRRVGWWTLKRGDLVQAVVKGQGLKAGEKVEPLALLRIADVRREPLRRMTDDLDYGFAETAREGFREGPLQWPSVFVEFFCRSHRKCTPESEVNRIEFTYEGDAA